MGSHLGLFVNIESWSSNTKEWKKHMLEISPPTSDAIRGVPSVGVDSAQEA
jgi:hypothetical protein